MSNLNDRDYAGAEELPDGNWAQRVIIDEQDARMAAIEEKLEEIRLILLAGIQVQVVTSL